MARIALESLSQFRRSMNETMMRPCLDTGAHLYNLYNLLFQPNCILTKLQAYQIMNDTITII